jgi:hypothetical protein
MSKTSFSFLPRREFLSSAFLCFTGCCLSRLAPLGGSVLQTEQSLPEELTTLELETVRKSTMAGELDNYFGKGYSCAESLLMLGLRYLHLSEELVWVAAGFGGGMQHREACGFLTAGIMDLGLALVDNPGAPPVRGHPEGGDEIQGLPAARTPGRRGGRKVDHGFPGTG